MSIRFSKNSQASSSTQATSGKLEEKRPHVLLLLLLVYYWVTKLVMREGLARCDSSPQGKTGDVVKEICDEKQVYCVYDVETGFEKTGSMKENSARFHIRDQGRRLEGKVDCEKWDIRRLTVNRALLSMEPRLESMGEMVEELDFISEA